VIATMKIYEKLSAKFFEKYHVDIRRFITFSQLVYIAWTTTVANPLRPFKEGVEEEEPEEIYHPYPEKKKDYEIEIPSPEKHQHFTQAVYGGRVIPVKRAFKSKHFPEFSVWKTDAQGRRYGESELKYEDVKDDYIVPLDAVSLYSSAMDKAEFQDKPNDYPIGISRTANIVDLLKTQDELDAGLNPSKLGIYRAKIFPNKRLLVPSVPRKFFRETSTKFEYRPEGGIIWDLEDHTGVYTTIDLYNLVSSGGKVQLLQKDATIWDQKAPIFSEFMKLAFEIKKEGDGYAHPNDPTPTLPKNEIIREIGKGSANHPYGKSLQKTSVDETIVVTSKDKLEKFLYKYHLVDYSFLNNNTNDLLVSGKLRVLGPRTVSKATQNGAFILSYSRMIMEHYFNKLDPYRTTDPELSKIYCQYYGDTDSIHQYIPSEEYYNTVVKPLLGKKMGQLDNDLKDYWGKIIKAWYISPKLYAAIYIGTDNKLREVVKAKGIPKKLITFEDFEAYMTNGTIKKIEKEHIGRTSYQEVTKKRRDENGNVIKVDHYKQYEIYSEVLTRKVFATQYEGRDWFGDFSYPKGFDHDSVAICA
jgi:hypothetical protein